MDKNLTNEFEPINRLDVTIYGAAQRLTDTLSLSRVRIFYKGMNRNRTFISEDFANQLIESLPYTPVKGIFDKDSLDYEDHGENNTDGKIYGIVPENPNFAWEDFQDEDGVTRSYACCDIYLFTGLYPEANLVPGKSQSMEIFRKTLQGEWRLSEEDGKPFYYFKKGSLVGLQVLGDDVEPCFEGSAFFTVINDIMKDLDKLAKELKFSKKEENKDMDKTLFRLSDDEKADILFDLVNPNFNQEGGWKIDRIVTKVYDDYALCCSRTGYERIYYTKTEDSVTIGEIIPVKVVDVTETEYTALEAMKSIGGTYEAAQTEYNNTVEKVASLEKEVAEFNTSKETLEQEVNKLKEEFATFETEKTNFTSKIEALETEKVELNNTISDLKNENEVLSTFKKNAETAQKENLLQKYEEYFSEEVIGTFKADMDKYSVEDFKKEVCTAVVENSPSIFSHQDEPKMFSKGDGASTKFIGGGAIALLNKRKNGGNK